MEDRYQKYQHKAFSSEQWHIIKTAIDEDIDVTEIANERFTPEKMELLIEARKHGIDISAIMDPALTEEQMMRIIDHISEEMGVFEEHYENVRRKWLKNITWIIVLSATIIIIGSIVFTTKDTWMKYFQELYLKFNSENVTLEAGTPFDPASYIKAYDPQSEISCPDKDDVNVNKPGSYWVSYKISNSKKSKTMKLLVHVIDRKPPVIALSTDEVKVDEGTTIKPLDYLQSAKDNVDGDITNKVQATISKNKDMILYDVTDSSGNKAEKKLKVSYIKKPVITEGKKSNNKTNEIQSHTETNAPPKNSMPTPSTQTTVTAEPRNFPFEDNKSFDATYQECMNYGQTAVSSGKANTASCTVYDEDGIHKGYTIHFN